MAVMKQIGFCILLISFAGVPLFSLPAYPENINNGTILINGGIGIGKALESKLKVPPLILSLDTAIPFASLPFTAGLAVTWSAEEGALQTASLIPVLHSSGNLGTALRIGYHEGWGIKNFDSYLQLILGGITAWETVKTNDPLVKNKADEPKGYFWFGFGAGVRWFFTPIFGINAEISLGNLYNLAIAVSIKV